MKAELGADYRQRADAGQLGSFVHHQLFRLTFWAGNVHRRSLNESQRCGDGDNGYRKAFLRPSHYLSPSQKSPLTILGGRNLTGYYY